MNQTSYASLENQHPQATANSQHPVHFDWVACKALRFITAQLHNYIAFLCSFLTLRSFAQKDTESWIENNLMTLSEIKWYWITHPGHKYSSHKRHLDKAPPDNKGPALTQS